MIPLVERTIPIIIENSNTNSIPMETGTTGFPFDRDFNDDNSFREKLDNIAKRHPEFAEHLSGFPFRNHSGSSNLHHRFRHEPDFSGFSPQERSFVSTSRPCFDNSEVPTQSERQSTQSEQYPQSKETSQTSGKSSTPSINDEKVKIHSSNTVDLGQKQEPEVSDRNQRSMSAPPSDNNRQTFVSSINIPITRMDNMGNQHSSTSQSEQKSHQQKSNERVIPIHVEGRDEPVFPKSNYTQHQHHQPPPPSSSSSSQSERFFGHRPSHFSPFPKENSKFASSGCQTDFGNSNKSQQPSQSKEVPKQQPEEHNEVDSEVPLPAPEAPPPQSQPPPVPPKVEITPIDQIKSIQKDVSNLMEQVEQFNGIPKDKQYLYLDEMLTRNLIKLDNIDTQGQENIRQARREAIKCIESCISILEAKATANATALTLPPLKGPDDYINNKQNIINDKMDIDNKIENEKEKSNKESTKNIENEMEIVEINEIPNEKLINSGDDISNNNNDSNSELKMDVVDEKSDDKIKNSKKVTKKKKD